VRADRAFRPADRFQVLASLGFVGEDRVGEVGRHRWLLMALFMGLPATFVKVINANIFILASAASWAHP